MRGTAAEEKQNRAFGFARPRRLAGRSNRRRRRAEPQTREADAGSDEKRPPRKGRCKSYRRYSRVIVHRTVQDAQSMRPHQPDSHSRPGSLYFARTSRSNRNRRRSAPARLIFMTLDIARGVFMFSTERSPGVARSLGILRRRADAVGANRGISDLISRLPRQRSRPTLRSVPATSRVNSRAADSTGVEILSTVRKTAVIITFAFTQGAQSGHRRQHAANRTASFARFQSEAQAAL